MIIIFHTWFWVGLFIAICWIIPSAEANQNVSLGFQTEIGEVRRNLLEIRKELHDLKKSSVQKVSSNSKFIINGIYKPLRLKKKRDLKPRRAHLAA